MLQVAAKDRAGLPPRAAEKLDQFIHAERMARLLAEDARTPLQGIERKLSVLLQNAAQHGDDVPSELQQEIDALQARVEQHKANVLTRDEEYRAAAQTLALLDRWLSVNGMMQITDAPPVNVPSASITEIREQIGAVIHEMQQIKRTPLIRDEIRKKLEIYVAKIANDAPPRVNGITTGEISVTFPTKPTTLLAWLMPDLLVEGLLATLPPIEGMSAAEKAERQAKLEADLLALERQEEALICSMRDPVARRPGADPRALLEVVL